MVVSIAAQPRSARFSKMSEVEWFRFRNIYFICESALMRVVVASTRESAIGFNGSVRSAHCRVVCFVAFDQADSAKWRTDSESNYIYLRSAQTKAMMKARGCRTATVFSGGGLFRAWPFYPPHPLYRHRPGRFGKMSAAAAQSPSAFFADGPVKGGKGGKGGSGP